ncbi:MAG: AraC family transcriptional regulator [Dehalococcoidia bacterium]
MSSDEIRVWTPGEVADLELMHASVATTGLKKHVHDCLSVSVTESGSGRLSFSTVTHAVTRDDVAFFNPGEVHAERRAGQDKWVYRTFLVGRPLLLRAAEEVRWHREYPPRFPVGKVRDPSLAQLLRNLHRILEQPSSRLECESWVMWAVAGLVRGYGGGGDEAGCTHSGRQSLQAVRNYLHTHYGEDVSIKDLAKIANMSPTHLIRSFHGLYGMPPMAYQQAVRIVQVKRALRSGSSIVDAALEAGFYDQSHLNRVFKRVTGITPGQYRVAARSGAEDFE